MSDLKFTTAGNIVPLDLVYELRAIARTLPDIVSIDTLRTIEEGANRIEELETFVEELETFVADAFEAHSNLDLDVEYIRASR
jgi:hypothetical protein